MDEITDLDIYYDLGDFAHKKKSEELKALEAKYQESLRTIESLTLENKKLKKQHKDTEVNFQNLLETAKAEINRKNRHIAELRKELDDVCFRRKHPRVGAYRREVDGDHTAAQGTLFKYATVAVENERHAVKGLVTGNEPFCLTATTKYTNVVRRVESAGVGKSTSFIEKEVWTLNSPMHSPNAKESHRSETQQGTSAGTPPIAAHLHLAVSTQERSGEPASHANQQTTENTHTASDFQITQKNSEDFTSFRQSRNPKPQHMSSEENAEKSLWSHRRDLSGTSNLHSKYTQVEPYSETAPRKMFSLKDYKRRGYKEEHHYTTDDTKVKTAKRLEEKYKSTTDDHRESTRAKNPDERYSSKCYDVDLTPTEVRLESRCDRSSDKRHTLKYYGANDKTHKSPDVNCGSRCDKSSPRSDITTYSDTPPHLRSSVGENEFYPQLEATNIQQLQHPELTRKAEKLLEVYVSAGKLSSKEAKAKRSGEEVSKQCLSNNSKELKIKADNDHQELTNMCKERHEVIFLADAKGKPDNENNIQAAIICQTEKAPATYGDKYKGILNYKQKNEVDSLSRDNLKKEEATPTHNFEEPNNVKLWSKPAATEIGVTYELNDIPGLGNLNDSDVGSKKLITEQTGSDVLSTPQKVALYNELFMQKSSKRDGAVEIELFANVMQILNAPKKEAEKVEEVSFSVESRARKEVATNPNEKLTSNDILGHHEHLTLGVEDFDDFITSIDSARLNIDEEAKAVYDEFGQLKLTAISDRGKSIKMKPEKNQDNVNILSRQKNKTTAGINETNESPAGMDGEGLKALGKETRLEIEKGSEVTVRNYQEICGKNESTQGKLTKPESLKSYELRFDEKDFNLSVSKCLKADDKNRSDDIDSKPQESSVFASNAKSDPKLEAERLALRAAIQFEEVFEDILEQNVERKSEINKAQNIEFSVSASASAKRGLAFEDLSNEPTPKVEVTSNAKKPHIEIIEVINLPNRYKFPKKDIIDGVEQKDCQPLIISEKTDEKASSQSSKMDTEMCSVAEIIIGETSNLSTINSVLAEEPRSIDDRSKEQLRNEAIGITLDAVSISKQQRQVILAEEAPTTSKERPMNEVLKEITALEQLKEVLAHTIKNTEEEKVLNDAIVVPDTSMPPAAFLTVGNVTKIIDKEDELKEEERIMVGSPSENTRKNPRQNISVDNLVSQTSTFSKCTQSADSQPQIVNLTADTPKKSEKDPEIEVINQDVNLLTLGLLLNFENESVNRRSFSMEQSLNTPVKTAVPAEAKHIPKVMINSQKVDTKYAGKSDARRAIDYWVKEQTIESYLEEMERDDNLVSQLTKVECSKSNAEIIKKAMDTTKLDSSTIEASSSIKDPIGSVTNALENRVSSFLATCGNHPLLKGFRIPKKIAPNLVEPLHRFKTERASEKTPCDENMSKGTVATNAYSKEERVQKEYAANFLGQQRAAEKAMKNINEELERIDLRIEFFQTEKKEDYPKRSQQNDVEELQRNKKLLAAKEISRRKLELLHEHRRPGTEVEPQGQEKLLQKSHELDQYEKCYEKEISAKIEKSSAEGKKPYERELLDEAGVSQQSEKMETEAKTEKPLEKELLDEGNISEQSVKRQTAVSIDITLNQFEEKLTQDQVETSQKKDNTSNQSPQIDAHGLRIAENLELMSMKTVDGDKSIKSNLTSTKHKASYKDLSSSNNKCKKLTYKDKIVPYELMHTATSDKDTENRLNEVSEVKKREERCNSLESKSETIKNSKSDEIKESKTNDIKESKNNDIKETKKYEVYDSKEENKIVSATNRVKEGNESVIQNDKNCEAANNKSFKNTMGYVEEMRKEQREPHEANFEEEEHECKSDKIGAKVFKKSQAERQHEIKGTDGKTAKIIKCTDKKKTGAKLETESKLKTEHKTERSEEAQKMETNGESELESSTEKNRDEKSNAVEANKKKYLLKEDKKGTQTAMAKGLKNGPIGSKRTCLSEREDRKKTERKISEQPPLKQDKEKIQIDKEESQLNDKHKRDNQKLTTRKRMRSLAEESEEGTHPEVKSPSEPKGKKTCKTKNKERSEEEGIKISESMKAGRLSNENENKTEKPTQLNSTEEESSRGKICMEIMSENNHMDGLIEFEHKEHEKKDIITKNKEREYEIIIKNAEAELRNKKVSKEVEYHVAFIVDELIKAGKPVINPTAFNAEAKQKDKLKSLIKNEPREKLKNETKLVRHEMRDSTEVIGNNRAVTEGRNLEKIEACKPIEKGERKDSKVKSKNKQEKLKKSKKARADAQSYSTLEKLFKEMGDSEIETSMEESFQEKTSSRKRVTRTKKITKQKNNKEKPRNKPENKIDPKNTHTIQIKLSTETVSKKACERADVESKAKGCTRQTNRTVTTKDDMQTDIQHEAINNYADKDELILSAENVVECWNAGTERQIYVRAGKQTKCEISANAKEVLKARETDFTQSKKIISSKVKTPKSCKKRKYTKLNENNNDTTTVQQQISSKKFIFGDNIGLSPISTTDGKLYRTADDVGPNGPKMSPVSSMQFEVQNKYVNIDKRVQHMSESTSYERTARPAEPNVHISDELLESSIASTVVRPQFEKNSHVDITIEETRGDSLTLGVSSLVHDSSGSMGTKSLTLGKSDYRFEKISDNVVNLFITRRRGKKKLKLDSGA